MALPVKIPGRFSGPESAAVTADVLRSTTEPGRQAATSHLGNAFLFVRVLAMAAAIPYLLRLKLNKVAAFIEPGSVPVPVDPDRIKKIAAYVETAIRSGRPIVRSGCLTRGLTRYYFLRRAGLEVALHFGMGQIDGAVVGHCWLVREGQPFLEKEDPGRYVEMYRISRQGGQGALPGDAADWRSLRNER
jgi:hypothetical protein